MSNGAGSIRAGLAAIVAVVLLALGAPSAWAAPANDDFAAAQALTPAVPAEASGDTTGATEEAGEPDHAGADGAHSVWFTWTPSESGRVGIATNGCFSNFQPALAVYTGEAVGALTPVASGALSPVCFGEGAQLEWDAAAGTTYRIAVDGSGEASGSFSFTIQGKPVNDDFADASVVPGDPATHQLFGTTRHASSEPGEPLHAGQPGGNSVWWSWTPETSGPIAISTCSSFNTLDTLLGVYTGDSVGALTKVAANDDAPSTIDYPGCAQDNSEVRFEAVAGTTYRIAVDSSGGTGRFTLKLHGHPANDAFATPQTLEPTLPLGPSGSTDLATAEAGEPAQAGVAAAHSVWYSWTPSSGGRVFVSTCVSHGGEVPDMTLAVYTGSSLGSLTTIGANDDAANPNCHSTDSEVSFVAVAGTTYRIAVDSKGADTGEFSLQLAGPPANDDFAGAQALSPILPTSALVSTRAATEQAGEPEHGGSQGAHSVWYSWTPASSGSVVLSDCPYTESAAVPLLGVYTGDSVEALNRVAAADDAGAGCGPGGAGLEFEAVAGTTYRIAVDGQGGSAGVSSLEIGGRPANDDFAAATTLAAAPMTAGGDNRLATKQAGEPDHAGQAGGHSLWWNWTPSASGPAFIAACGQNREIDPLLAVYTGSGLDSLTQVAADDDGPGTHAFGLCQSSRGDASVEFDAVAGTTYRIAVDGKGGSTGRFALAFERAPANDAFASAQQLSGGLPLYGVTDTRLATKQAGEPNHAGDPGGHSVWYSWTAPSSAQYAVSACAYAGEFEPLLAVYSGSAVAALTPVAAGAEESGDLCHGSGSEATFTATAGTTYRIAVDGAGGGAGSFQLTLQGVQANDDFDHPESLGGGLPRRQAFDSNRFATVQSGEPDHAGVVGGASIWFKWTAPVDATVSIDTCGSGIDTLLGVYEGSALGALTAVAANDDASGKCAPQSRVSFDAVANTTYRIAVDGKGGAQGPVQLTIAARPRNDDFAAAEPIAGSLGWYVSGTTGLATKQAGEPNHAGDPGGHSVWYSWTPAKAAAVELDVCTDSFEPLLGVYTGDAVGALTPVATTDAGSGGCEEGRSFGFEAQAGTTYRLAVDGEGGEAGSFELHLRPAIEHPRSLAVETLGAGSILAQGAGITCSDSCSYDFEVGETVTLEARPEDGASFIGWLGGSCEGAQVCTLTLNADTVVRAQFVGAGEGGGRIEIPSLAPGSVPTATVPGFEPAPTAPAVPKPLRCKANQKKVHVHGKAKCVKKKAKHHRKGGHARG